MSRPTDPPDPSGAQSVKEGEAERATITEQPRACLDVFHQGQHLLLAIVTNISPPIHAHPWVATHSKQGADLACEQARVPLRERAQPGQKASQTITRPRIDSGDRFGPGARRRSSQGASRVRTQALTGSKSPSRAVAARSMRLEMA